MSNYAPDKWSILEIDTPDGGVLYKVFGSWSGGYLDSDSWRMNSGIVRIEEEDDAFLFYGNSGSCYVCSKHSYGATVYGAGVIASMLEKCPAMVRVLPEDTDWNTLKFDSVV